MSTNTALDQIKNRAEGHTEGPWQIEEGDEAWEVRAPEGSITWDDHGGEVFRNRADAELIAAAPKLLAALEAVEALAILAESTLAYGVGGVLMAEAIRTQIEEALS